MMQDTDFAKKKLDSDMEEYWKAKQAKAAENAAASVEAEPMQE